MKKQLLFFVSVLVSFAAQAQMSIPNGDFESWTSGTYDFPMYYPSTSNPQTFFECHTPFNATKSIDAYHGSFALQMTTNAMGPNTCMGYMANADVNGSGGPSSWTGGMQIAEKPLGVRGYYKYNVASGDSAGIIVVARLGGSTIGTYLFKLSGMHSTYTMFDFTFSPALSATPDSIIFAATSSDPFAGNPVPGSTLLLDSVSFTGITTQPAEMNGDFEMWQTQTVEAPNIWNSGDSQGRGTFKTTDHVGGSFAVELHTYAGDNNGSPRAQPGQISTGYWDESCSCQKGGYPFTNQIDTLVFSYKYAPANPTDSAVVFLNFRNSGTTFLSFPRFLHTSASYQQMEIPINLASAPDSVIIDVMSSSWADTTLNFVGAVLKVDGIHFKSQPLSTGINVLHFNNEVSFYPNPLKTSGTIMISPEINTTGMIITIYDLTGKAVSKISTNEHKVTIDRSNLQNGFYFYELKTSNNVIKTGKIVVE